MYTLEQIESIWRKNKPLYYRISAGRTKGGDGRGSNYYLPEKSEGKEAERISPELKEAKSLELWESFNGDLANQIAGLYTVTIQTSKTATNGGQSYTFVWGDYDASAAGVGSVSVSQGAAPWGGFSQGMGGGGNMGVLGLMLQMQQNQNTLMMQMMTDAFKTTSAKDAEISKKELELYKALNDKKGIEDKIVGVLTNQHFTNLISGIMRPQAVGRATATEGATVPPVAEQQAADQMAAMQNNPQVQKLQEVLAKIKAAQPDKDPIDVLAEYIDPALMFIKNSN